MNKLAEPEISFIDQVRALDGERIEIHDGVPYLVQKPPLDLGELSLKELYDSIAGLDAIPSQNYNIFGGHPWPKELHLSPHTVILEKMGKEVNDATKKLCELTTELILPMVEVATVNSATIGVVSVADGLTNEVPHLDHKETEHGIVILEAYPYNTLFPSDDFKIPGTSSQNASNENGDIDCEFTGEAAQSWYTREGHALLMSGRGTVHRKSAQNRLQTPVVPHLVLRVDLTVNQ